MKGNVRLEDGKRIERVLYELNMKYLDRKNHAHKASNNNKNNNNNQQQQQLPQQQSITMNNKAVKMMIDYSTELVTSILESSCLLAQHRNSKIVDEKDINMILGIALYPEII
jgi:hypothetical protein